MNPALRRFGRYDSVDVTLLMSFCWSRTVDVTLLISLSWCPSLDVNLLISLYWCHYSDITLLMSLCWCHSVDVTMMMSLCWCHSVSFTLLMSISCTSYPALPQRLNPLAHTKHLLEPEPQRCQILASWMELDDSGSKGLSWSKLSDGVSYFYLFLFAIFTAKKCFVSRCAGKGFFSGSSKTAWSNFRKQIFP